MFLLVLAYPGSPGQRGRKMIIVVVVARYCRSLGRICAFLDCHTCN